ncbi:MAG: prolyl oligopeptidase family serine peptidase [Vicinamibacterales bacterium]
MLRRLPVLLAAVAAAVPLAGQTRGGLMPQDLRALQSVADVQVSPDGSRVAYSVLHHDAPGRPSAVVTVLDLASGRRHTLPPGTSGPRWSPDGRRLAFLGRNAEGAGLMVAEADGSGARLLAPVEDTNHPLPSAGESVSWAPDGRRIAYVSATAGPESEEANGDPMVITRYLYKPTAGEGSTRFNDNRRTHVFVVDVGTRQVTQLTEGTAYEHSIDWAPAGDDIVFVSNREADPDKTFNYDVFTVSARTKQVRRLTTTRSAEYAPVWSPDGTRLAFAGTRRDLTSSETTMEDTHVWVMQADGTGRVEIGAAVDNRQGPPRWSPDGRHVYFSLQDRGHVRLARLPAAGGEVELVVADRGSVGAWGVGAAGLAYAFTTPDAPADLYTLAAPGATPERRTTLNQALLAERTVAAVEALQFTGRDGTPIEAFLTVPLGRTATSRHPLVVMIHGGPHGQQGPAFTAKAQVYAAQGWAALMVNYRGSTGYGQALADKIFGDQNGGEAEDVLAGVEAALARYPWIDAERLGIEGTSYGGQLTNWIITQTDRFKAAIPNAGISNLVSFNYMAYYHDYLAVEYGRYPHQDGLMDTLWAHSPLRLVHRVKTPTLITHGENDNDVPIAEAEQFYVALHDVGVPTVLVRYPREGHGLRETGHVVDQLERSLAWYRKYFGTPRN